MQDIAHINAQRFVRDSRTGLAFSVLLLLGVVAFLAFAGPHREAVIVGSLGAAAIALYFILESVAAIRAPPLDDCYIRADQAGMAVRMPVRDGLFSPYRIANYEFAWPQVQRLLHHSKHATTTLRIELRDGTALPIPNDLFTSDAKKLQLDLSATARGELVAVPGGGDIAQKTTGTTAEGLSADSGMPSLEPHAGDSSSGALSPSSISTGAVGSSTIDPSAPDMINIASMATRSMRLWGWLRIIPVIAVVVFVAGPVLGLWRYGDAAPRASAAIDWEAALIGQAILALILINLVAVGIQLIRHAGRKDFYVRAGSQGFAARAPAFGWLGYTPIKELHVRWSDVASIMTHEERNGAFSKTKLIVELGSGKPASVPYDCFNEGPDQLQRDLLDIWAAARGQRA